MADPLKPSADRLSRQLSSPTISEPIEEYEFTLDEEQPIQDFEEFEFEETIPWIDSSGKQTDVPVYDNNKKKIYRPTYRPVYNEAGEVESAIETHDDRGIMTFEEWKRKQDDGVDWYPIAKQAVIGLAGGFGKIPGKIKEEGLMEASANIPESFLAATEGLKLIGGGIGRFAAKPFRTKEEEDRASYEAYKDFGNQIFRQLELRKSRMGDVARYFGADELAEVYDDGIDPEIADSLSLIFDPTYLIGGGLVKVGAAAAKRAPKVTNQYAKKMINTAGAAASSKAAKQLGEFLAKPITTSVSGIGSGVEKVGRGVQWAGEGLEKFSKTSPGKSRLISTGIGAGAGYSVAPEGQELAYVAGGALGGAIGGRFGVDTGGKFLGKTGDFVEKNAQRIGGAAQAAKINSVRTSGLGTVAKIRPMREDVVKQFVTVDNRLANKLLSGAGKMADTVTVGAGMGAGLGAMMPYDPTNPGWIAGMGLGTIAAPAGKLSAEAFNQLARVEISRGGVPDAGMRLRLKETPMHQMASEAVVKRFLSGLPEQQRARFVDPNRNLSIDDLANQAEAVDWLMGARRDAGKDTNFFIGDTQEIQAKTGGIARDGVAGFYDADSNTVYINTDAETPSFTLFHEVFHPSEKWSSLKKELDEESGESFKSDPLQDIQTDLAQTIFGTYAPDGEMMKPGIYSKSDMLSFADQYNGQLYPDLTSEIIAKKAEIKRVKPESTAELAKKQDELNKLLEDQELNKKELDAFNALPDATKRDYMARELMSDYFAMFGESARHGIIRKARNITLKKDYFKDKFLGMNIDKLKFNVLGRLKKTLEARGVEFDLAGNPRGDMTATSALFKYPDQSKNISDVKSRIREERAKPEADEPTLRLLEKELSDLEAKQKLAGKEVLMSPEIEHLLAQYITEKDKLIDRVSETSDTGGSEVTVNAKDLLKKNPDGTPKIPETEVKRWARSGWLKTDKDGNVLNSTGGKWQPGQKPAFTTPAERTRMEKKRVEVLVAALKNVTEDVNEDAPDTPIVKAKTSKKTGKTNFRGSYFDDQQMDAIMGADDDVVHPDLKATIKMMNDAIKEGTGAPFLADYWKAISGRGYDSKARMKVQLFTPFGMEISGAGNFNAKVFNIGYFENKINRWLGQTGKRKFWSDWADSDGRVNVDEFRTDMMNLLDTHYLNDTTVKFPDGMKKEKLYSFLGVKPDDPSVRDWNRSKQDSKLFISLRFDRMREVARGMGQSYPVNYHKAKARYMPGNKEFRNQIFRTAEPRPVQDDLGFFSRVEQVAMGDKIPNRGSGDQMLATIKKQPGVKQEELQWLGLEDYLRGKKQVTKQELTDFIRENDIQLEETMFSGDRYTPIDPNKETSPTQYEEYQLPGSEDGSYKEMLLRLPGLDSSSDSIAQKMFGKTFEELPGYDRAKVVSELKKQDRKDFRSSHFDEPNVLAHVRFNDRIGPNGEKILFVEELQSDWHSAGRKSGYGEEVPDAPFKSSWHELATKRMLRYAAENGYDKLAFIDGKQTSARYKLSNQADFLAYRKTPDGSYRIEVGKDGDQVISKTVPESRLANFVGKDIAEKMKKNEGQQADPDSINLPGSAKSDWAFLSREERDAWTDFGEKPQTKFLRGLDLEVGGDWAFNLYDKMIPQFLKKYGKKFGAKVEDVGFRTIDPITGIQTLRGPQKAIDITPQMRGEDGVMGGQVRFMPGIEKVASNEPGIATNNVNIKSGAFDGVRFMPGTSVPKITLDKIAESNPFIITADSMADMTYTVPDSGVEIKLHGGPMFSYRPGNAVWASNKSAAGRIGNHVDRTGQRFALIMLQNGVNHAKNKSMGRVFVEELKARKESKKIKSSDLKKMLTYASERAGLEKPIKNLTELEDFYSFWDWDVRGKFFDTFGLVRTPIGDPKKAGFFDYKKIVRDTTQPQFLDKPTGTIVGAIEFKSGKRFNADELGAEPHSSYDTMLEGRGVGLFKNPPHISDVLDVPDNQRSVFTLQKRLSSPNKLKQAADAESKLNAIRKKFKNKKILK
tara:strand:- start:19481 stop:25513 length:6033 start_codon:yes stop_codon:yes gene_type:complete